MGRWDQGQWELFFRLNLVAQPDREIAAVAGRLADRLAQLAQRQDATPSQQQPARLDAGVLLRAALACLPRATHSRSVVTAPGYAALVRVIQATWYACPVLAFSTCATLLASVASLLAAHPPSAADAAMLACFGDSSHPCQDDWDRCVVWVVTSLLQRANMCVVCPSSYDEGCVSLLGNTLMSAMTSNAAVVAAAPGTKVSGLAADMVQSGLPAEHVAAAAAQGALHVCFPGAAAAQEGLWLDLGSECLVQNVNVAAECSDQRVKARVRVGAWTSISTLPETSAVLPRLRLWNWFLDAAAGVNMVPARFSSPHQGTVAATLSALDLGGWVSPIARKRKRASSWGFPLLIRADCLRTPCSGRGENSWR